MAVAVTYTQEEIDTLKAAIVSGVLSVTYAGPPSRTVTYQSLEQMAKQLARMEVVVAAASETPRRNYRRVTFKRGFRDDG